MCELEPGVGRFKSADERIRLVGDDVQAQGSTSNSPTHDRSVRLVVSAQVDGAGTAVVKVTRLHAFDAVAVDESGGRAAAALASAGIVPGQTDTAMNRRVLHGVGIEDISVHSFPSGLQSEVPTKMTTNSASRESGRKCL